MPRVWRAVVVMLAAGPALLLAAPSAGAHALLVSSDPADGVSLEAPPSAVTLTFTEEPDPGLSSVDVIDSSGTPLSGEAEVPEGQARTMRVEVPELEEGVYTVVWRVLSRVDGHFTAGAFAFGVGVDPGEIEEADVSEVGSPPLSPSEPAGRFLLYAGLAGAVGAAWVSRFAFESRPRGSGRLLVVSVTAAVGGFVLLSWTQQQAANAGWIDFLGSSIGKSVAGRGLALAFVVGGALAVSRAAGRAPRGPTLLVVAGGLAAIAVHVSAGHAATGAYAWLKVATQVVHFAAVTVWIGGLAALLVGVRGRPDAERATAVRRFSGVAGPALAVVVGTGTARAVAEVGSWGALVETGYGRVVIAKVALVGAIAALAARNRWRNVPEAPRSLTGLRRVSGAELTLAAVVLVLTGVLASLVPARSVSLAEPASSVVLEGSDFARTVDVRLEITPGYPGANRFEADVDVVRGSRDVEGVTLRLRSAEAGVGGLRLELSREGETWRTRSAAVGVAGTWDVIVVVERGADTVEVPLEFHTRCRNDEPTTPGPPRLYDVEVPGTGSVQAYVDPAAPGFNEVHFTFFDARGDELSMADDPGIEAFSDGTSIRLDARRFSPGHFIGGGELDQGSWVFEFEGATEEGRELNVCFEDQIS